MQERDIVLGDALEGDSLGSDPLQDRFTNAKRNFKAPEKDYMINSIKISIQVEETQESDLTYNRCIQYIPYGFSPVVSAISRLQQWHQIGIFNMSHDLISNDALKDL